MTLIRSRTLFDYEDNESVSAPLRTFFRNSDDHQFSSRSPSYNLERRTSRRSAYSFRGQPSFHDVIRNEVGMLSNPITITVESRDASNQSGRKLPSSKNGRVWSKDDSSYPRELNAESRQGVHWNSPASSPKRCVRALEDEEKTIRVNNYGRNNSASTRSRNSETINSQTVSDDAEPLSIPMMKCTKLDIVRTRNRTPTLTPVVIQRASLTTQNESPEAHLSIEVELQDQKKKGLSQLKSIIANEILKSRSVSRGRTRELRDDSGRDIIPQRLFSRSQSNKESKLGQKIEISKTQTATGDESMTPGNMKRLVVKLASFRRSKSRSRSDSTDATIIESSNSPRTVLDAPQVVHEERPVGVFREKPKANKFCGVGMCITDLGEFFVGDSFGEENQYPETETGFAETHV